MERDKNEQGCELIRPGTECFCLETHMHTSQSSACGRGTPEEMAEAYKKAGYDGIIVTDHFMNGNSCIDPSLSWTEQVDCYCLAYEKAHRYGEKIGLSVFFGYEYNYNATEFITLGLEKKWLKAHPEIMTMPLEEYLRLVKKEGGLLIHVHPFREASYISKQRFFPDLTDAVEVINIGNKDKIFDRKARDFAIEHHLPMTSGSDCHAPWGKKGAGIAMDHKPSGIEDIMNCIRSGKGYTLLGETGSTNTLH